MHSGGTEFEVQGNSGRLLLRWTWSNLGGGCEHRLVCHETPSLSVLLQSSLPAAGYGSPTPMRLMVDLTGEVGGELSHQSLESPQVDYGRSSQPEETVYLQFNHSHIT